ncbi:MAG: hypothetical protein R3B90_20295 [Planctomycetaceae bacterium]
MFSTPRTAPNPPVQTTAEKVSPDDVAMLWPSWIANSSDSIRE